MKIGFTGVKEGISNRQRLGLVYIIGAFIGNLSEFHHGDCIGADEEFHKEILLFDSTAIITIHPPNKTKYRAFCEGEMVLIYKEKNYIQRNHDIVKQTDLLIATPNEPEKLRSEIWATVRYARKLNKPVIILDR